MLGSKRFVHSNCVPVNCVISRERGNGTIETNVLSGSRVDESLWVGGLHAQSGTVLFIYAGIKSVLECISVCPSHDKITVQAVTSGIGVREGEMSDVAHEWAGVEEELVKEREEGHRVGLRAHTSVVVSDCWIGHVARVVRRVNVFAIPTRGEVDLSAQTQARASGKAWSLIRSILIQAHHINGLISKARCVLRAARRITGNHTEPRWECRRDNIRITLSKASGIVTRSQLIVVGSSLECYHGVLSICVMI